MTAPLAPPRPRRLSHPAPVAEMAATLVALANALFDQRCPGLAIDAFPGEVTGSRPAPTRGTPYRAGC